MLGINKKPDQAEKKKQVESNLSSEKDLNQESNPPRLSNLPRVLGVILIVIFAAVILFGLIDFTDKQELPEKKEEMPALPSFNAGGSDYLSKLGEGGAIEAAQVTELKPAVAPANPTEARPDVQPAPTSEQEKPPLLRAARENTEISQQANEANEEENQLKQMRTRLKALRQQQFERALTSRIGVNSADLVRDQEYAAQRSSVDPDDPSSIDAERARVRSEINRASAQYTRISGSTSVYDRNAASGGGMYGTGGSGRDYASENGRLSYDSFDRGRDWKLNSTLENPDNAFMVRAGTVVPATLISGINSDLPGQIIAQVSQNVYDTATGKYLLIPQGSRLIGTYGSQIAYGQERVMVAWQRIVYPDNRAIDIGSMPGTDVSGYSGMNDKVNAHWWKLLSSAFLMSGIVATVSVATEDDNGSDDDSSSVNDTLREALATQFGNVIARIIERNLNLSPTLEIRPGYKFNVMVTRDMDFLKPYKMFNY